MYKAYIPVAANAIVPFSFTSIPVLCTTSDTCKCLEVRFVFAMPVNNAVLSKISRIPSCCRKKEYIENNCNLYFQILEGVAQSIAHIFNK